MSSSAKAIQWSKVRVRSKAVISMVWVGDAKQDAELEFNAPNAFVERTWNWSEALSGRSKPVPTKFERVLFWLKFSTFQTELSLPVENQFTACAMEVSKSVKLPTDELVSKVKSPEYERDDVPLDVPLVNELPQSELK